MRLLLFLLLPLLTEALNPSSTGDPSTNPTTMDSSTVSVPVPPPSRPSPPSVIFNNIMTDYLICASERHRDGTFSFEKCARYPSTGMFPFCVYMVIPSTEVARGSDAYGCVYAHRLPDECADKGEFYSQSEKVKTRGKEYEGAMMCCMENYCNQLEEPVFSMVRVKNTSMDDVNLPFFILIAVFIILLAFLPHVQYLIQKRTDACNSRSERPAFLENSIGSKITIEIKPIVKQQSMRFPYLRKMQDVVRKILQPNKYGTNSATNHEHEQPEKEDFKDLTRKDEVYVFQRDNEFPRKLNRQIPSRYEHLAQRMIEHGPFFFDFDPVELGDLFDSVAQILAHEPTLLELQPEIDVYGNLEGSYGDLFRWMHKNGWPPKRKVLFLGGLTHDEEPYSLETIALIFAMKKLMPNHVFIIRGAAEVYPVKLQDKRFSNRVNRFLAEVIQRSCGYLPLAATVHGVFFSHGGLSPKIKSLKSISDIKRPISIVREGSIEADLIFTQASFTNGVIPGSRGWQFSKTFQPDYSLPGKANQKIQMFVRARNSTTDGFMFINRNILSIWSAPGYPIENKGGVSLSFNHEMEMTINKMGVYGTYERATIARYEAQEYKQKIEEYRRQQKQRKSKEYLETKGSGEKNRTLNDRTRSIDKTKSSESPAGKTVTPKSKKFKDSKE